MAVLVLVSQQCLQGFAGLFGLPVGDGQQILARIAVANGAQAWGASVDRARVAADMDAVDRAPDIDLPFGHLVRNVAMKNTEVLVPPRFELFVLPVDGEGVAERIHVGSGLRLGSCGVGQRIGLCAEMVEDALLSDGRQKNLIVEHCAGIARQNLLPAAERAFNRQRQAFVPVVSNKGIPVAAETLNGFGRGEPDQRNHLLAGVVGVVEEVEEGLALFVEPGVEHVLPVVAAPEFPHPVHLRKLGIGENIVFGRRSRLVFEQ